MRTEAAVQYIQILFMRSKYLLPKAFTAKQTNIQAQNIRTVCQVFALQSSRQSPMAERMSWAPEKFMERVTVQFPTRLNQPVIQDAMGAYFRVDIIADQ